MFSFILPPVRGGSGWQRINLAKARAAGNEFLPKAMLEHYDLHWRLWVNFEDMARHCARVGATVLLEWPRYNDYWKEPRVAKFLDDLKFRFCDFDGCMYGLRPINDPYGDTFIQTRGELPLSTARSATT